jgi:murein L,D-transpeptidase YafK
MNRRALLLGGSAMLMALSGCSDQPRFLTYDGPPITSVVVYKAQRQMYLLHGEEVMRHYDIDLGFTPIGHKEYEGDGRTPEGAYRIHRRNPNSAYHLSIGISYPDNEDRARARQMGKSPGGDIFIHGTPNRYRDVADWTAGCIAITNREVEEVYSMVSEGTVIYLHA